DLGHRTTVLMGDLYLEQRPWEFDNGLKVLPIPTVLRTPFHPALFPMTPGLVGQPAVSEADVVQTGEFHQPSSFFASVAAREAGVPLVLWQETFAPMQAPGSLYQRAFETTAGRRIRDSVQRCVPRTTKAEAYLRQLGIPPDTIAPWVPTGVDVKTFAPRKSQHAPEDFGWQRDVRVLLLVSRLNRAKGVDLALRALAEVLRKAPDIRLLIRGSGPELPHLRRLIIELHLEENVRLLGRRSREELISLYNMADIVLSASRKDLLPFSLMEASACGRPCVATDVGAVRDIVADGETGFVVSQDGSKALGNAVLSLLDDEDLRTAFGSGARKRMEKYFGFAKVAKNLLEVYRGAAG
ncbi:MAG: glycosyltransferase family 4 protein, partial [candidate division NC10 bacterium]